MHTEYVQVSCTDTNKTIKATLVSRNDQVLTVYIAAGDTKLTMVKRGSIYVGTKAGLEFTSTGVPVK